MKLRRLKPLEVLCLVGAIGGFAVGTIGAIKKDDTLTACGFGAYGALVMYTGEIISARRLEDIKKDKYISKN
jgi:hypothetical protein